MYVCYTYACMIHTDKAQLNQVQATQDSIEKLAEANNFRKVDWDALEGKWALDYNGTLTQLDNEIKAITPAFGGAKKGLEAALA